jgi:peroxiredoxin Q/BCP
MRLREGQPAPLFEGYDLYGRYVNLAHYAGRMVLVSFYRAAICPLCNVRLWHMANRYATYQQMGLEIIGFVESHADIAHQYLDRMPLPFPLIPDRYRAIYSLYGLESSLPKTLLARVKRWRVYREAARLGIGGNDWENLTQFDGQFSRMPGDFLLGPDLIIRRAHYGSDAGDFMLFSELESLLQRYGRY